MSGSSRVCQASSFGLSEGWETTSTPVDLIAVRGGAFKKVAGGAAGGRRRKRGYTYNTTVAF